MVIRMGSEVRRSPPSPVKQHAKYGRVKHQHNNNTRAEFRRLKTILPSLRRKENVSRLDIILEAIKYIDDLQDQLIDRLAGPKHEREAALQEMTERDLQANSKVIHLTCSDDDDMMEDDEGEEDLKEDKPLLRPSWRPSSPSSPSSQEPSIVEDK